MKKILILTSNPLGSSRLRLDKEVREIDIVLQKSKQRELFDIKTCTATRPTDVHQALLDYSPQIVHFCGHGEGDEGLVFEADDGSIQLVGSQALASLFELFSEQVKCVVLNSCYSEKQASAIAKHIDTVIGMNHAVGDEAAIYFAEGFYRGLGAGKDFEFSYKLGCNFLSINNIPEENIPILKTRQVGPGLSSKPKVQKKSDYLVEPEGVIQYSSTSFKDKINESVSIEMVHVPEGVFWMGSTEHEFGRCESEGPQHKVKVSSFAIGKFPITREQWYSVSFFEPIEIELPPEPSYVSHENFPWRKDDAPRKEQRPVDNVSWLEAVEFCARLSRLTGREYRLPTEAEWEYACRAGTKTPYSFGEKITTDQANFNDQRRVVLNEGIFGLGRKIEYQGKHLGNSTEVGKFPCNDFNICDMHGNVNEWCLDHWHENYDGAPDDGSRWLGGNNLHRVIRGGSHYSKPKECRSASRGSYPCDDKICPMYWNVGFRVCCPST